MAKTTRQEKYIAALTARGETLVKITAKYRVFTRTRGILSVRANPPSPPQFFYVGCNGAVRYGRTITTSRPVSDAAKAILLEEYEAAQRGAAKLDDVLDNMRHIHKL